MTGESPSETKIVLEGLTYEDAVYATGLLRALGIILDNGGKGDTIAAGLIAEIGEKLRVSTVEAASKAGMDGEAVIDAGQVMIPLIEIFDQEDR